MDEDTIVLLDAELEPDPEGDNELSGTDAVAIADEHLRGSRVLVVQRSATVAHGGEGGSVELGCTFHPAVGARFSQAHVALRLSSPPDLRIVELQPRSVAPPTADCLVQGSGEATSLAKWTFREEPGSRRGIGGEHRLRMTLPAAGIVRARLSVAARLARDGVGGMLDELRDLVVGSGETSRARTVELRLSAATPRSEPRGHAGGSTAASSQSREVELEDESDTDAMELPPPSPTLDARPSPTRSARASILLCTANAVADEPLDLESELKAIRDEVRKADHGELYSVVFSPAVTFATVIDELDDRDPTFLHFCGHGDRSGDLILRGEDGREHRVAPASIAALLVRLRRRPLLVTFATCHSERLAKVAAQHVAYAIGFAGELDDESAIWFSRRLYGRIAAHEQPDVPRAFELAKLACLGSGHPTVNGAQIFIHPGVTTSATPEPSQKGSSSMQGAAGNREDELLLELAKVFYELSSAQTMVTRAGLPRHRVPMSVPTSLDFWKRVMDAVGDGGIEGVGVKELAREALRLYPGNRVFQRHAGR